MPGRSSTGGTSGPPSKKRTALSKAAICTRNCRQATSMGRTFGLLAGAMRGLPFDRRAEELLVDRHDLRLIDLRQALSVVLVGLVHLHLEREAGLPCVEAGDVETACAQFMHKLGHHETVSTPILASSPVCPLTTRSTCP
jgi:hypothetical protein